MSNQWTKEQIEAIHDESKELLVAAAAGSGKTAVLVERIINKIINKGIDIDKLLIVTFTNAAAAEMRERIFRTLMSKLNTGEGDSQLLRRQITLLNNATITTLHSFCLELSRKYCHLLGIDGSFRIADEIECQLLQQEVIDNILEGKYQELSPEFEYLVDSFGGDRSDDQLVNHILNIYKFTRSQVNAEEWLKSNINDYKEVNLDKWISILIKDICRELEVVKFKLKTALRITSMKNGPKAYYTNIKNQLDEVINILDSKDRSWEGLAQAINTIEFGRLPLIKKADKEFIDDNLLESVKNLRDECKKTIKNLIANYFSRDFSQFEHEVKGLTNAIICLSDLVLEFSRKFSIEKKKRKIVDFNDLEHFAIKLLSNKEIKREISEKFTEVLVDEYQDINNVQETIIGLVSENCNLFMVGDVKQSIYRFRLADPTLFQDKNSRFPEDKGKNQRKILLSRNFRSSRSIVDGVNFLFKQIMTMDLAEIRYLDGEELVFGAQHLIDSNHPVEVYILDKGDNKKREYVETAEEKDNNLDSTFEDDSNWDQKEARFVAKKILDIVNEGKIKVYDKNLKDYRNVKFSDIVILLRTTKTKANIYSDELAKVGIPCHGDLGTGYFDAIEVMVILSLLKIIDNPLQDIPVASVLRSPIVGLSVEDIALIKKDNTMLWDSVENIVTHQDNPLYDRIVGFYKNVQQWRTMARQEPVSNLLWSIYNVTGYFNFLGSLPGGKQRQANLTALYDRAKQYDGTSYRGLFGFLRFIERLKESNVELGPPSVNSENADVVRIISIHKSKGLEFPIVIVPDIGKQFNLQDLNSKILLHKELGIGLDYVDQNLNCFYQSLPKMAIKSKIKAELLAEELRILYVAFTRAKEKLILTGSENGIKKLLTKWQTICGIEEWEIPSCMLSSAKKPFDWIIPSIIRHREFPIMENIDRFVIEDNSRWNFDIINMDCQMDNGNEVNVFISNPLIDKIKAMDKLPVISPLKEIIYKNLDWEYPNLDKCQLPQVVSVSQLRKNFMGVDLYRQNYKGIDSKLKTGLSSAEIGTLIHRVFEHIDISIEINEENIKKQIKDMVEKEIISDENVQYINIEDIIYFFSTPLGVRMKKAPIVKRELPFILSIDPKEVYEGIEFNDESIFVQGIIDCVLVEDDGLVLIDFKNDNTLGVDIDSIKNKYDIQIKLYKRALEESGKIPVKESYLYLISGRQAIKIL